MSPIYYVIMVLVLALGVVTVEKDANIDALKIENAQEVQKLTVCSDSIKVQNALILANKQDENKTKELPKIIHDIRTKTVTQTRYITLFKDDENVSKNDCNASINFINNFDYSL